MTLQHWQVLTAITDTSLQGAQLKVSGEPTPFVKGEIKLCHTLCQTHHQLSSTLFAL